MTMRRDERITHGEEKLHPSGSLPEAVVTKAAECGIYMRSEATNVNAVRGNGAPFPKGVVRHGKVHRIWF